MEVSSFRLLISHFSFLAGAGTIPNARSTFLISHFSLLDPAGRVQKPMHDGLGDRTILISGFSLPRGALACERAHAKFLVCTIPTSTRN